MKKWTLDNSHTDISFSVKHMGILNVRGSFSEAEGSLSTDDNGVITSAESTINVKSITTRNKDRDGHLLTGDFLLVDTYPTIKFRSTKITPVKANEYEVTGNLSIRGVTKQITLTVKATEKITDLYGLQRIAIEAETSIDRLDYGVTWNQQLDNGSLLVGNEVKIAISSEFTTN